MRVVKRVTAALIAVIISFSASIVSFADETDKDCSLVIKENGSRYFICVFCDAESESFKRIDIFKHNENGEKILLKMFYGDEGYFSNSEVMDYNGFIAVVIKDKEFFEPYGNYTIEFYPHDLTPEGYEKEEKISIDFDFAECIEPKYENIELYETVQVDDEIDINTLNAIPDGFMGKYHLEYYYNYLGDDDNRKLVSARNGIIKGLREGSAKVEVVDTLTDKTLCTINVDVEPKKAENFLELLKFTFQALGGGAYEALRTTGNIFLGAAWGVAVPVAVILTAIGSLIFI